MPRKTGRPQSRRTSKLCEEVITVSYSLPQSVAAAVKRAARDRSDQNKSALVTEVLADHFGIKLSDCDAEDESEGGEAAEK